MEPPWRMRSGTGMVSLGRVPWANRARWLAHRAEGLLVIRRFQGEDGRRVLLEALRDQKIVGRESGLAEALLDRVVLLELAPGDVLIHEGGEDNDLYLLLSGSVTIKSEGREVARRDAGLHVGEMALLDPAAPRSATVVAADRTVVARVSESDFTAIATAHPELWRAIAIELRRRLADTSLAPARPSEPALRASVTSPAQASGGQVRPGALSALLEELWSEAEQVDRWEQGLVPGAVIGRFELIREIGRGGLGVVWQARDRELGRTVAFKAVRAGGRPEARAERLAREAEAAARLSHPNIVTLYDAGHGEHGPYLILELLHGETLAQRLERGPLPGTEALRIAVEVAKGLAHAHGQGVVHRDLTPGNVFLCIDGRVKVLDLGMAHAFGRRKVEGGTPAYMSPEQRRGAPEDERSDVFALGVLLYRMLSGELPSSCEEDAVVEGLGRAAPPGLGQLIGRLLAADPVDRPRDAGEVLERLAEYRTDADDRRGD